MKKLALVAALAFGTFLITQTGAFAEPCSTCAVEQPDTVVLPPMPGAAECNNCTVPAPPPQRLAECGGCAVEQPDTVVLPPTPEDGCNNCVLPTPAPQRLADSCSSCAIQQD